MGRLATGIRALGKSSGVEVNVLKETPGPQRMRAWKSWGSGILAGIAEAFLNPGQGKPLLLCCSDRQTGTQEDVSCICIRY